MSNIHPTAEVDKGAEIGNGVEIGPFCVIGPNVKIGDNTVLHSHVSISGHTTIGTGNEIFPYASVGHIPQDLKFKNEKSFLEIGDGKSVQITKCPSCGGKIKSPSCCGEEMICSI